MGAIPQCPDGVWPLMQYQVTVFDALGGCNEHKCGEEFNPLSKHTAMDTQVPFCALSRFWCLNSFTLTH
jgi:hypothetical protein